MPTTYTGDQTQTQLPSDPPEPEGSIQVSLPADGDMPNGATFEQAYKVLADFIDWLIKPAAAASVFEKAIMAFRAAIGHRRFAVDHVGFPNGQVLVNDVNWVASAAGAAEKFGAAAAYAAYRAMPEWAYKAVNVTGTARAIMAPSLFGAALGVLPGEALNDYCTVYRSPMGTLRADNHVTLDFTSRVPVQDITTYIGVCDEPGSHLGASADFIGFRITGALTWECITRAGGVTTATNSGVTAAVGASRPDRLRVEWSGETVADDSTRAVRFYVNGVLRQTHTANLPLGMLAGIGISQLRASAAAGGDTLVVGPMRFRMSLSEVDTVL